MSGEGSGGADRASDQGTGDGKQGLRLRVAEARGRDVGRGLARVDPEDLRKLGAQLGDLLQVRGKRSAYVKALPAYVEQRGAGRIHLDGLSRDNAQVGLDDHVRIVRAEARSAQRVNLKPLELEPDSRDLDYLGGLLDGVPVATGDRVRAALFGGRAADFEVAATRPGGPVWIVPETRLVIDPKHVDNKRRGAPRAMSYEDIGGLGGQLQRIREMIELPLRYPEVFERLGVQAPRGVLLHGTPGCGKTLIARVIAQETEAAFFSVSGPEIIHKLVGESEAHLRKVFDQASAKAPAIVFLDEVDAIAPRREDVTGEVEKRVVAQLLALMDGLDRRRGVLAIAATNRPNALDPALRRPGRFDREINIPVPDPKGRREILEIHTRGMPLADDVDLVRLAGITHGYVGADLQALCRESAMVRLRHLLPDIDFGEARIPYQQLQALEVEMADFVAAKGEVQPSTLREAVIERPQVPWSDVAGLEQVKRRLLEALRWPLQYPQLYAAADVAPPKGILMSGPPGCGKTLIAKALATEGEVNFLAIKGSDLLSKYVGESEQAVREIFRKARQAAPAILFLDELESLVPARGGGGGDSRVAERVLSQFLVELDGVESLSQVLVLGATNRPDLIDGAILRPGRFDLHIEVPLPDAEQRQRIFAVHLQRKPIEGEVDLAALAAQSHGLSGAAIAEVCRRAAVSAVRRSISGMESEGEISQPLLRAADLEQEVLALRDGTEANP